MIAASPAPAPPRSGPLLHSRYEALASNTIDYWMLPDDRNMTRQRIENALATAKVFPESTLQIYLHVPFCAQRCRFCAFSGGNALDFRQAERYSRLVVAQMRDLLERTRIRGTPVRSVNIGGGSPDLVGTHIRHILKAVRDLPGVGGDTEIAVEFTLSTVSQAFIEELARFEVTKASFGVQSLNPQVRRLMRQPKSLHHLDQVLRWIDRRIPVVNADLITGLPGQDLGIALADLRQLMDEPRINAISSYLLTPGAAPSLLAGLTEGKIPALPEPREQALMRLHSYTTFLQHGWTRRGTNTYIDPARVPGEILTRIAGNECIGTRHYEDFLLAAGPQAVSCLPGARVENHVDIKAWASAIENGGNPFHLRKCSDYHQRDTALWVFPLRWEGLDGDRFTALVQSGAVDERQTGLFRELEREGLITHRDGRYRLSVLGEVFMGRLVRDLKQRAGQQAVDQYISEGYALGQAISSGALPDENAANNRQLPVAGDERGSAG